MPWTRGDVGGELIVAVVVLVLGTVIMSDICCAWYIQIKHCFVIKRRVFCLNITLVLFSELSDCIALVSVVSVVFNFVTCCLFIHISDVLLLFNSYFVADACHCSCLNCSARCLVAQHLVTSLLA